MVNTKTVLYVVAILVVLQHVMHFNVVFAQKPNIVFILSDDHRSDQLSCAGHPIVKTPNIDQLAAAGVRFTNMFVTTSICAASRATIFTGMYERGHRYTFGTKPLSQELVDASYPVQLSRAGYLTGFVGKFGVKIEGDAKTMWDYYRPLNRTPYFKKQPDGSKRHATQLIGDKAVQFLQQQSNDKPFCLSISFNAPHAEDADKENHYPVPKIVNGMYDDVKIPIAKLSDPKVFNSQPEFLRNSLNRTRYFWRWDTAEKYAKNMRGYWGMISGVDHVVGRVRAKIDELGFAKNTIIIFTGDNGYYLGQRGFAGKWSHYEESLRVPLVVYDPRVKQSKQVRSEFVLNVDLAATMLGFAGVDIPECYQGRRLNPLVADREVTNWRTDFFCEHLMNAPKRIPKWEGVRGSQWTYARYTEQQPVYEFLHNLVEDPNQLTNYATDPQFKNQLSAMRQRCDELMRDFGDDD